MFNSSSRALIFNKNNEVSLVTHNYINPKNNRKWSTVGGRKELEDISDLDCLKKEITEEFGINTLNSVKQILAE